MEVPNALKIEQRFEAIRGILSKLVGEIEQIKANQAVIVARVGTGVTISSARDAKNLATQADAEYFRELQKEIEAI